MANILILRKDFFERIGYSKLWNACYTYNNTAKQIEKQEVLKEISINSDLKSVAKHHSNVN